MSTSGPCPPLKAGSSVIFAHCSLFFCPPPVSHSLCGRKTTQFNSPLKYCPLVTHFFATSTQDGGLFSTLQHAQTKQQDLLADEAHIKEGILEEGVSWSEAWIESVFVRRRNARVLRFLSPIVANVRGGDLHGWRGSARTAFGIATKVARSR